MPGRPVVPLTSAPGSTTTNGTNIFGKASITGVLRAADIDLVAVARCTSTKSVVQ